MPQPPPAAPDARARPGPRQPRRRLLRLALWGLGALLLLAVLLMLSSLLLSLPADSLPGLLAGARRFKFIGLAVQLIGVILALWRWKSLVNWAIRRGHLRERERQPALAARRGAALLMLALLALEFGIGDLLRLVHTLVTG